MKKRVYRSSLILWNASEESSCYQYTSYFVSSSVSRTNTNDRTRIRVLHRGTEETNRQASLSDFERSKIESVWYTGGSHLLVLRIGDHRQVSVVLSRGTIKSGRRSCWNEERLLVGEQPRGTKKRAEDVFRASNKHT